MSIILQRLIVRIREDPIPLLKEIMSTFDLQKAKSLTYLPLTFVFLLVNIFVLK